MPIHESRKHFAATLAVASCLLGGARLGHTQDLSKPVLSSRCAEGQSGALLCLQGLRQVDSGLRGYVTFMQRGAGLQPVVGPSLSIDSTSQHATDTVLFEKSGELLSVVIVMKLYDALSDQEAFPALRRGVGSLLDAVRRVPDSRVSLIGYNVTLGAFQPDVQLGDTARVKPALDQLSLRKPSGMNFELADAIGEGITRLVKEDRARRRLLIIYTDGQERAKQKDVVFQRLTQQAQSAEIVVQVVMMPSIPPRPYLTGLAEATGGLTQQAQDNGALEQAFRHIADEILRQSVVVFGLTLPPNTPLNSPQKHQITLAYQGVSLSTGMTLTWSAPQAFAHPALKTSSGERIPSQAPAILLTLLCSLLGGISLVGLAIWGWRRWSSRSADPITITAGNLWTLSGSPQPVDVKPMVAVIPIFPVDRPSSGTMGQASVKEMIFWVYDVSRQRTQDITKFPFSIGNDLDCDLVLGGLGTRVSSCQLRLERQRLRLRKQRGEAPQHNNQPIPSSLILPDQAELTVAGQRLIVYETAVG